MSGRGVGWGGGEDLKVNGELMGREMGDQQWRWEGNGEGNEDGSDQNTLYIYVWGGQNETHYQVELIYANKYSNEEDKCRLLFSGHDLRG